MPPLGPLGLQVPDILLPGDPAALRYWPVIACDQYTSQPEYWDRLAAWVGDRPSTLHLVLPEAHLGDDEAERIGAIHARMQRDLDSGVFAPPRHSALLVDRATPRSPRRLGLMVALDLERYDYRPGATTLARATERTVEERLPAREAARAGARLELPHVMVLIDDPDRTVVEPLAAAIGHRAPLYDLELFEDAGRVRGWTVDAHDLEHAADALAALADPDTFRSRYAVDSDDVLLYAVGDGNHSLGAAKLLWEKTRADLTPASRESHPARFALVELLNVHDPGISFEPIHRVVFDAAPDQILVRAPAWFADRGARFETTAVADTAALAVLLEGAWKDPTGPHAFGVLGAEGLAIARIYDPPANLAIGSLQAYLDDTGPYETDYIHGDEALVRLATVAGRSGFWLPAMNKTELFPTVIRDGALPRKTFSMGEAEDKRFYLEARIILP